MNRLKWQEAPKAERLRICGFYADYVKRTEGRSLQVEYLDEAWRDCWFDVIKFTFGPDAWRLQ